MSPSLPDAKPIVSQGIAEFMQQGILGVMCVLLMVALFFSIKSLLKSKDDRIADQKQEAEALQKLNEATRDLVIEMNKAATNLVMENGKHSAQVNAVMDQQCRAFEEMTREMRLAKELKLARQLGEKQSS
jgi:hypothetical protein